MYIQQKLSTKYVDNLAITNPSYKEISKVELFFLNKI